MLSTKTVGRVRTLFLQCVSLTYAVAFYSFYTQIPGVYGDDGILPAAGKIEKLQTDESMLDYFWKNTSMLGFAHKLGLSVVQMMELMCLSGTSLALLVTFKPDLNIKPTLIALWAFYISLFKIGQTFMHFQWDILLLETGFLAIIFSPMFPGCKRKQNNS